MFYKRYLQLCDEAKLTPSAAATKAGFNRGTVSVWKKKYEAGVDVTPDRDVINKICAFFGCTESWIRGITTQKEKAAIDVVDDDLQEYLDELRNRPEKRMLFSVTKNATKSQIEAIVKMIEEMQDRQ